MKVVDPYNQPSIWHEKPEAWHEIMPGVQRRIVNHASSGMMVFYRIESGKLFPWHNHPHAQYGVFLEGGGTFRVGEIEWRVKQGDGYFIPPGVYHELRTDGDKPSVLIDFFTPQRDDYLSESLEPDKT